MTLLWNGGCCLPPKNVQNYKKMPTYGLAENLKNNKISHAVAAFHGPKNGASSRVARLLLSLVMRADGSATG